MNNYTRWYLRFLIGPWHPNSRHYWSQFVALIACILAVGLLDGMVTSGCSTAAACGYIFIQLVIPLIAVIRCKQSLLISDLGVHVKAIADAVTSVETKYGNGQIAENLSQYNSCVETDSKTEIRATILQSYKEITEHVSWLRKETAQVEVLSRELAGQQLSEDDKNKLREFGTCAETNVRKSANMLKAFDGVALDELRTDAEVSYAHSSLCLQNLGALLVLESLDEETWEALGQNRTRQMADGQTITLNPSGKKLEDESNVVQIVCRQAQS